LWGLLYLGMKKAEIRKLALAQRKELSEAQVQAYSMALLAQFSLIDLSAVKTVHIFLPILEKKEPDTFLFIEWLSEQHPEIKIIVPRADFDAALMISHVYTGRDNLQKNLYHIPEPQQSEVHTGEIDLVIVPLLAFDLRGYRVGYGKGFYDRFLGPIQTQKVGLSFFDPVEVISDADPYDVRLDSCITPEKIFFF